MGSRPEWLDSDDREDVRRAIESELTESHRQALAIEASRLPRPDRWPEIGWLRNWAMRAAAFAVFERLQSEGCTKERARERIYLRLGVPVKTMERWEAEIRRDTWAA